MSNTTFKTTSLQNKAKANFPASTRESAVVKSGKKIKIGGKKISAKKEGNSHWGPVEQRRYIDFLRRNEELFDLSLQDKKKVKIYVLMSKYIKIRDSLQCRSHHQKMVSKYDTIPRIIE